MKNQIWSIIIAIGIALGGYFIYCGIGSFAGRDRYVGVKGLSEREVLADKATWNLSVNVSGNVLERLYPLLDPKMQTVVKYLKSKGVTDEEIIYRAPSFTDRSERYDWDKKKGLMDQYVVTGSLTIVSMDVEKIRQIHMNQLELLQLGVSLEASYLDYEYTGLNALKPEMVEEATRNARIVADKFAKDADCTLGSIRTARQGQFQIESDDVLPHKRKVRVVTTIEYYLK